MNQTEQTLRRRIRRLEALLLKLYPYVPHQAGGRALQDELERAVMGGTREEVAEAAYAAQRPSEPAEGSPDQLSPGLLLPLPPGFVVNS